MPQCIKALKRVNVANMKSFVAGAVWGLSLLLTARCQAKRSHKYNSNFLHENILKGGDLKRYK